MAVENQSQSSPVGAQTINMDLTISSGTTLAPQSTTRAFTVGAGGFSLSTGTFTPNNATMTVNGACAINSGTFNAPSGPAVGDLAACAHLAVVGHRVRRT